MQTQIPYAHHELTHLWDQLVCEFLRRVAGTPSQAALEDAFAAMHLTAHLVARYIGDSRAVLRPTMTLPQLADKLRRETDPVVQCVNVQAQIETFGLSTGTIADSRWLLALWSLVMDMMTATGQRTRIEVNIGACQDGFEIEVGHDACRSLTETDIDFSRTLTGRWLHAICPEWSITLPACPLGGRAVQVRIPARLLRHAA